MIPEPVLLNCLLQSDGWAGWRMASPAMRVAILATRTDTFGVLIDEAYFEPRCVDEFSKHGNILALPQSATYQASARLPHFVQNLEARSAKTVLHCVQTRGGEATVSSAAYFGSPQ
jgi:hypothetical protein